MNSKRVNSFMHSIAYRLPPREVTRKGPVMSMKNRSARSLVRLSVDIATA